MSEHVGNLIIEPHQVGTFQVYHDSDDCAEPHAIFDTEAKAQTYIDTATRAKEHQNNE